MTIDKSSPLYGRPGLQVSSTHPLVNDVRTLVEARGLAGAVLVAFDMKSGRVSVTSHAGAEPMRKAMKWLGDQILAQIDDERLDPPEHLIACPSQGTSTMTEALSKAFPGAVSLVEEGYRLCPDCGGTRYILRLVSGLDGPVSSIASCLRCGYTGVVPDEDGDLAEGS